MPLPESPTHAALTAAEAWLAAADAGDADGAWRASGASFRAAVDAPTWAEKLAAARGPLGPLDGRRLAVADEPGELTGAPPGRYVVLQYHAVFGGRRAAVEALTLQLEPDGAWRVVGYFIR